MAVAGIQLTAEIAELKELQQAIGRIFTPADKATILQAALEKAVYPAFLRLKETTPVGPTGNLKRAATYKVKPYPKSGNAVALLGYTRADREKSQSAQGGTVRAGKDLGYHQWWLEQGTQERFVDKPTPAKPYKRPGFSRRAFQRQGYTMTRNGKTFPVRAHTISGHSVSGHDVTNVTGAFYYASSFKKLGPFKVIRTPDERVQTDPSYPNAFFMKSRSPIRIPPMPVGGQTGRPPLQTAWDQTRNQVAEILQRELRISLERALEALTFSATGTAS